MSNLIEHGNADESPKNFRSYIVKDKCTADGELAVRDAGHHIKKLTKSDWVVWD